MRRKAFRCLMPMFLTMAFAAVLPAGTRAEDLKRAALERFGGTGLRFRTGKTLRFEEVDRRLAEITAWLAEQGAQGLAPGELRLTFGEIFAVPSPQALFPLTNTVVRLAPEESLSGLTVRDERGRELGAYRFKYSFTSSKGKTYTLWCFQYETPEGRLQQTGHALLLDRWLARWTEIASRVLVRFPEPPPGPAGDPPTGRE